MPNPSDRLGELVKPPVAGPGALHNDDSVKCESGYSLSYHNTKQFTCVALNKGRGVSCLKPFSFFGCFVLNGIFQKGSSSCDVFSNTLYSKYIPPKKTHTRKNK